ncbi:hypothetical protein AB9P05_01305 [Roseivirga sp. BDSF3-8]|uniref:hypothetical protein n=1 Tax=Roseivirga sp. BDSF3-8 TaxID=3241598 RepID=UPI0035327BEA
MMRFVLLLSLLIIFQSCQKEKEPDRYELDVLDEATSRQWDNNMQLFIELKQVVDDRGRLTNDVTTLELIYSMLNLRKEAGIPSSAISESDELDSGNVLTYVRQIDSLIQVFDSDAELPGGAAAVEKLVNTPDDRAAYSDKLLLLQVLQYENEFISHLSRSFIAPRFPSGVPFRLAVDSSGIRPHEEVHFIIYIAEQVSPEVVLTYTDLAISWQGEKVSVDWKQMGDVLTGTFTPAEVGTYTLSGSLSLLVSRVAHDYKPGFSFDLRVSQ